MNALDRILLAVAPSWALTRMRARAAVAAAALVQRHYDAAGSGYRTDNWIRRHTDANAANGPALGTLRAHARDLFRNNGWAQNGVRAIGRNAVGWGLVAKATNARTWDAIADRWNAWAGSTQCDADGRSTLYGLQHQVMETVAVSGEVLVRKRPRRIEDGYAIPLQIQVLEPDLIDTTRDGFKGLSGGPTIQGVEFDMLGHRAAYWLYEEHPGGLGMKRAESKRVPASRVAHVFRTDRPGQVRGVSWLAPAIVALKDFDEFEDATIVRQKIAAMFSAFITDPDGTGAAFGETDGGSPEVETMQPGMIVGLAPGKEVSFASPPSVVDGGFTERVLRKVAAGMGVTYEDLTGDYSKVNFSSARLARLSHWGNVHQWRWNMLIPQFCDPVWSWAMEQASIAGLVVERSSASWTPPPMPMIEPDKEGLALMRLVRSGAMTPDEMVREMGFDPDTHWAEYAAALKRLDALGIVIDSDARKTTQAGLAQASAGSAATKPVVEKTDGEDEDAEEKPDAEAESEG